MKKILFVLCLLLIVFLLSIVFIYVFEINVSKQPKKYTQVPYNSSLKLDSYSDFKTYTKPFAVIPGLKEKIVPQGLTYSKKYNMIIMSGYHYGSVSSVLFFIDFESKQLIKSLVLVMDDNTPFIEHAGGVTTNDEILWIASDYKVYEYSLEDLVSKKDMETVKYLNVYETFTKADFITYHNGILWIGEYNYKNIYKTKIEHQVITPSKEENNSLLSGYVLDEENDYYKPDYLISIPDRVQGLTFDSDNNFIFSRSFWSFQSSNITVFPNILNQEWEARYNLNGEEVPLSYFDDSNYIFNVEVPPMSEEIVSINDELYMLFESYSNLYKYYTTNRIDYIVKIEKEFYN